MPQVAINWDLWLNFSGMLKFGNESGAWTVNRGEKENKYQ